MIAESVLMSHHPYSLYNELRLKKQSLTCSRITSPLIKIAMPFDILLFNGEMRNVWWGTAS